VVEEPTQLKPRGRPAAFSDDALARAAGFSYARRVSTRRGAQDLVYRMFAIAVIEHYCEAFPQDAEPLRWYFAPKVRHTLLTELGRTARPRSDGLGGLTWNEDDVARMIDAALELAATRPTTKAGAATLRARRRTDPDSGSSIDRVAR
jgi:hypothetical protein